jgi:hypothetical protein
MFISDFLSVGRCPTGQTHSEISANLAFKSVMSFWALNQNRSEMANPPSKARTECGFGSDGDEEAIEINMKIGGWLDESRPWR